MSKNGFYNDTPFQIDYEGSTIELKFNKLTPDTAELTWNIPQPFVGCGADDGAYNGIIITLDDKSVRNEQRPDNETYYIADATADIELHGGDLIGSALVVGAFYDDTVTNRLLVSNIKPNTSYYFSGYAVDKQGRYFKGGSHAYALEWNKEKAEKDLPAYREFRILGPIGKKVDIANFSEPEVTMLHSQWTGLKREEKYKIEVATDTLPATTIELLGSTVQTYEELVWAINDEIAQSIAGIYNAGPPNIGAQYVDVANKKLYKWAGTRYEVESATFSDAEPSTAVSGSLWYNHVDETLNVFQNDVWNIVDYTTYYKPFNHLGGGDYWINGNSAAEWEGTAWCKRQLISSVADPSLEYLPNQGEFWFDESTNTLFEWDSVKLCWKQSSAIYSKYHDPNNLVSGVLWLKDNASPLELFIYNQSQEWEPQEAVYSKLPPKVAADGQYWVNTKDETVHVYDFAAGKWEPANVIYWHDDPTNRKSCDKWWTVVNGIDVLYIWDFISSEWVEVAKFTQSQNDPREKVLDVGVIWDKQDGTYFAWDGMAWEQITAIKLDHNPRMPIEFDIVKIGDDWKQWIGSQWVNLSVISKEVDPTSIPMGEYWFDTANTQLKVFGAFGWTAVPFSMKPQVPRVGDQYYDTIDRQLKEWKNGSWVQAQLPIRATIDELSNLLFIGSTLGSKGEVCVNLKTPLGSDLKPQVSAYDAVKGYDAASDIPTYKQQGVGTDGSVDERRDIITIIQLELGSSGVAVELSKPQLERAVDSALEVLRQQSVSGSKRGFMFMESDGSTQIYKLTNKNEGYNKIVTVHGAFRTRGGRIGANSYNDPFEQSMLQQLFYAGSFDLLSYHLLASYNELLNEIFANNLNFTWDEYSRTLMFHQMLRSKEMILLDVMVERTEQDLFVDRYTRPWIIKYAKAQAMLILAQIRGKFATLPGAGGGVSLNANDLQQRAETMIMECMDDIENYVVNSIEDIGSGGSVLMG